MRRKSIRITITCAAAVLAFGLAAPSDVLADVDVAGNGVSGTKDCGGGNATISGNDNKLTLKGCKRVNVLGNRNKLTLAGANALSVAGNNNVVDAGPVRTISVMGNQNTVHYKLGPKKKRPRISNLGSGNKISPK